MAMQIGSGWSFGPGWYVGANSTNVSNNTGWIFAAFVPQAQINNINLTGVTITV